MRSYLPIAILLACFSHKNIICLYKPSSRTTHQVKRNNVIRLDSREFYIQDDIPKKVSPKRQVHPPAVPPPPPLYRQESTIGFSGTDYRSAQLRGGGGGRESTEEPIRPSRPSMEAQELDAQVRGMERLAGRRCCSRPEGQQRPAWFLWLFGRCLGERR